MYRATVKKARERLARVQARRKAEESKTKIILIVDDDAESVALVESIGRKAGYQVIGAESGEACLAMLPRIKPHLIMLDVNMGKIDGFETCRRVRIDPNGVHVPIAFLTARKTVEDVKLGVAAGGDEFIVKPFDALQLLERITFLITRSRALSTHRMRRPSKRGPPGAWLPAAPRAKTA